MRVLRAFEIVAFVLVSVASVSVYARRACVHHRPQEVNGCNARNVRNACNRGGGRTIGRKKCKVCYVRNVRNGCNRGGGPTIGRTKCNVRNARNGCNRGGGPTIGRTKCNVRNARNECNRGGGRTIGRTKCVPSSAERPDAEMPISRSISSPSIESWYLKPAERPREMVMVAPVEPTWGGDRRV